MRALQELALENAVELEADLYLCIRQNVHPAKKSNKGCRRGCHRFSALRIFRHFFLVEELKSRFCVERCNVSWRTSYDQRSPYRR